ncbi:MAG: DAK2 domain-containing protein, partial [Acidimicrobiales bacterium]
MATLERLDVNAVERVLVAFRDALILHRDEINALNVYPVPDGDTGTNMSLTLTSVVEEMGGVDVAGEQTWKAISHGSLMGARGNSGVILSQVLRALSTSLSAADVIDASALSAALTEASRSAYEAVPKPVEGTILTVVRVCAEAAADYVAGEGDDLVEMLDRVAEQGAIALASTPDLLPVLADAGVVDAGGAGFMLFIDALLHVVDDRPIREPQPVTRTNVGASVGTTSSGDATPSVASLRYEVMYFLEAEDGQIDGFKQSWSEIGDSIVVVGGDGLWNCHIHSNDIGASIEAGIAVGRPKQIRVTDLFEEIEHLEELVHPDADATVTITNPEPATTAVVAVAVGSGVQRIFESLGVHAVIRGGQSMNPSTRQLVEAVEQVDADQVVILPNNKNIIAVAEQVDAEVDKTVLVVGTRGVAEGFASLLAYDPGAGALANRQDMVAAADSVVAGEVTCAVRDSQSDVGPVHEGDWIGLDRGGVRSIAPTMDQAAVALLDALVTDGHELVTVIAGEGATAESSDAIEAWLGANRPGVEAEIHDGGQPLYP